MKTKHVETRMKQRGITDDEIELVHQFGIRIRDKIYLTGKNCSLVESELDRLIKVLSAGGGSMDILESARGAGSSL